MEPSRKEDVMDPRKKEEGHGAQQEGGCHGPQEEGGGPWSPAIKIPVSLSDRQTVTMETYPS
jgi:hypothetical protein